MWADDKIDPEQVASRAINARVGPCDAGLEVEGLAALRLDRAGRWGSLRWREAFWRRTVASAVVRCHVDGVRDLAGDDAARVHERARELAAAVREALDRGRSPARLVGSGDRETLAAALIGRLDAAAAWTRERHQREAELFREVYPEGVPILPPDRTRDLVVLATLGCPWGRCDFCAFYRDHPFHVLDARELREHLAGVETLFGDAVGLRRGVFLGAANALALPQARIAGLLEQVAARFDVSARGVATFWDPDHAPRRTRRDWEDLARRGLRRAIVGLETGAPEIRRALGKRDDIERIIAAVRELEGSGVTAGIVVLAGPGGEQAAARHRRETAAALARMELTREDLVYVSPLERDGSAEPLLEETARLGGLLSERLEARVVPYRMDFFRYYA